MEMSKGKQLAEDFGNFVNNYGHDEKDFIDGFMRQHRTLQQSSFRVILKLIEAIGSEEYSFDGRNEASHNTAKKIIKGFTHQNFLEEKEKGYNDADAKKYSEQFKLGDYLPNI